MLKVLNKKLLGILTLSLLGSSAAFADGGWVAIVFNPQTGNWGSYHGAYTRQDAENGAMSLCGAGCAGVNALSLEDGFSSLRETFAYNGWVAYAVDGNGHFGTSGVHDSQYDAEISALNNCQASGTSCYVVRSVSSFSYAPDQSGTNINN